jgi:hypothetical protein
VARFSSPPKTAAVSPDLLPVSKRDNRVSSALRREWSWAARPS